VLSGGGCVCVFLYFVDPILGNLTVRGHYLSQGTWGCRILTLHLNYVAVYGVCVCYFFFLKLILGNCCSPVVIP